MSATVYVKQGNRYVKRKPSLQRRKHIAASSAIPLPFFIVLAALIGLGVWVMEDMQRIRDDDAFAGEIVPSMTRLDAPVTKAERLLWLFADDGEHDPLFVCPFHDKRC